MSHIMCRECHHLVSEGAKTCPRCGISWPGRTEDADGWADGWIVKYRGALLLAIILFGLELAWFRHEITQLAGPPIPGLARAVDSFPGYRSLDRGLWLGARLHDRQSRAYVGRVTSLNCPDPTPWGHPWRCAEVEFVDGHREWIRQQVGAQRYLAKLER